MPKPRSPDKLRELFAEKKVVDLASIQRALGEVSIPTAFRYLKLVPYRRSYNHNGRFYALYDASRFDRSGLWSFEGIHFSVDGTLRNTVRRLVHEAPAGATHRELQLQLQLRVHNTLLELWHKDEVGRESMAGFYVYLHAEDTVKQAQLTRRRGQLAVQKVVEAEISDAIVIEVLLVLIRHPGSRLADVVRRLRGHSPPIKAEHVRVVFDRYDLEQLGEKGGPSRR
jgi:hypothetical protein